MELRDFRYVLAVAEELHFGRAAARLHMSQPPLSQRIRDIEASLGTPLFTRTSRRVALTPAGHALADKARHILALAEEAAALAKRVGAGLAAASPWGSSTRPWTPSSPPPCPASDNKPRTWNCAFRK